MLCFTAEHLSAPTNKNVTNWALPDTEKRQLTLIRAFSIPLLWSASEACGHTYLLIKKIHYVVQCSSFRLKKSHNKGITLHMVLSVYRYLPLCVLKINRILYIYSMIFCSSQLWTSFWLACSFWIVSCSRRSRFIWGWSTILQEQVCQNLVL